MTKSIKCSDAGVDCDWGATAETEEELFTKVEAHAKQDHGYSEIPPELVEKVKANIKEI